MKTIRIGSGAGYGGDRLEPALTLLEKGNLDYLCFECLAERTIALAQKEKRANPEKGYNHLLEYRINEVLPLAKETNTKIISNMGAANPMSAMRKTAEIAQNLGIKGLKIAAVYGDDVLDQLTDLKELKILETGEPLHSLGDAIISANAYLGVDGILQALKSGADIILTGRVSDPALFLAPMIYEFGWEMNDYGKLGKGTLIGHLLECAGQLSGGYFADLQQKFVPELWDLGFPFAQVDEKGDGYVSKVDGTGGKITPATCTEQLLYEIHDPANYLTPDCIADFSQVEFKTLAENKIQFQGGSGKKPTDFYKVSVGYRNGFSGEGQISYGGYDCVNRAKWAGEIVRKRLEKWGFEEIKTELIGYDSITPYEANPASIPEVRLRISAKAATLDMARKVGQEVETLYTNGPAAGGGVSQSAEEIISVVSVLLPKELAQAKVEYLNC
ncbi:acyclic terpene utilization AtuA family protein [Algoriphagus hitonicola]|uniref:Acyclic terpene utilisation N-terminal domain-containing protein n=1 Tax=Algoriphagus hitonicola TaxID=435880 RepID=A0A1I2R522_9BACT|nr:acyclic terpene utilization AtuA family protein [Algoriphagus hitonicola]SFG35804.1 Protein of unknown function [Algoriphagus hitonicola]